MGRQSKKSRIYWRERGGTKRAYADVRDYADVGGGREELVAEGEKLATSEETTATALPARRPEQHATARRTPRRRPQTTRGTEPHDQRAHTSSTTETTKHQTKKH